MTVSHAEASQKSPNVFPLAPLAAWIQPHHLQKNNTDEYKHCFVTNPLRAVILKQFLRDSVAERLTRFLRNEANYCPEYGLYSTGDDPATEQAWRCADEKDRFFRFSKLIGADAQHRMSPNMLTYLQFRKAFQLPSFREFFENISGMSLAWSDEFGSHAMRATDFLRSHDDNNRNRAISLVIYLSPDWRPDFGGALNLLDGQGRRIKIDPEYNSMVVFDVAAGTSHFVDPISSDAGDFVRLTIGGWYHKPS